MSVNTIENSAASQRVDCFYFVIHKLLPQTSPVLATSRMDLATTMPDVSMTFVLVIKTSPHRLGKSIY